MLPGQKEPNLRQIYPVTLLELYQRQGCPFPYAHVITSPMEKTFGLGLEEGEAHNFMATSSSIAKL